ncbi:GNAT family N-acetyltransferase [Corynebacterium aquilae]|uniref:Acetyltransferase n=1 Tax=Corynebacterium aquilae DSM 44791 TaxID=1431546 RepID=A0A1L7CHQ2_9CORY|nr:GNAT family N-acetyltransferase [Corynebacterium aquilae]APT85382.1 acetyltransferase [Corynebacterium aquilae DSM 44791]
MLEHAEIVHEPDNGRFALMVKGNLAGYADYAEGSDGVRDFNHTVVLDEYRGQGLSSPLIKAALDDSRDAGVKVKATCSAVEHFIAKNPEYAEQLAE